MTGPPSENPSGEGSRPGSFRIDIRRVTLHDYGPGQRGHFAGELRAQLLRRGAPDAAALRAAEAILDAADALLGQPDTGQAEAWHA